MKKGFLLFVLMVLSVLFHSGFSQKMPDQFHFSEDGNRLIIGGLASEGFYDESMVERIYLEFEQDDYWQIMHDNYDDKIDIPARLTYKGEVFDSVGVRFKGQTSFNKLDLEDKKKSFNITLDAFIDGQDIDGYETLNLNNCYQDPSFLHEVLYLNLSRNHIPSVKANYVELFINGVSWGLYPNVQQLNSQHAEEWFLDKDAVRWRCEATISLPRGVKFGVGYSTLNYLGEDTSEYKKYYTIKNDDDPKAWTYLKDAISVLNNESLENLEDSLRQVMDVDGTLWFLAHEILFIDDDGYVNKGGMDYYVYYDVATGRLRPIEYDGNSCMQIRNNTRWIPLYKQYNEDFPLMNRLFAVPALRQRYLAHVRTVLNESFGTNVNDKIDAYVTLIQDHVLADSNKIYSDQEFTSGIASVKEFFSERRDFLGSNAAVARTGLNIDEVLHETDGIQFHAPDSTESVVVKATISGGSAQTVNLYYGTGLMGTFERMEIFDNGQGSDAEAGDDVYSGMIPPHAAGTYVRYYIESVKGDGFGTRSYSPVGAEHDVYIYRINIADLSESSVVINEIMPSNSTAVADQDGEYDDWIELYNPTNEAIDLSGYFLTDNPYELAKWQVPEGTVIQANGYLIIWADNDEDQFGLHAEFKLSASGENVILLTPDLKIVDEMWFGRGETDLAYARNPNASGPFVWQGSTFDENNAHVSIQDNKQLKSLLIYPNPADDYIIVETSLCREEQIKITNLWGICLFSGTIYDALTIDVSNWKNGFYFINVGDRTKKLIIR